MVQFTLKQNEERNQKAQSYHGLYNVETIITLAITRHHDEIDGCKINAIQFTLKHPQRTWPNTVMHESLTSKLTTAASM